MKIFTIILGVVMAICGISCVCTPVITFMEAGYFLVILLLVYGIAAVVRAIMDKEYGLPFLFGVLSLVLAIVIIAVPGLKLMTEGMLIYIMAVWFLLQGVVGIFISLKQKKIADNKGWVWNMVLGIVGVLVGIYSLMHPMLMAFTVGILVGVYFIESGISIIAMACSMPQDEE